MSQECHLGANIKVAETYSELLCEVFSLAVWSWRKKAVRCEPTKLQLLAFLKVSNYAVWIKKYPTNANYIQTNNS